MGGGLGGFATIAGRRLGEMPISRQVVVTTDTMRNAKAPVCHGCGKRVALLSLDANNRPLCAECLGERQGVNHRVAAPEAE